MFQLFATPVSMLNVPGPRRPLRNPSSPGYAGRNRLMAAPAFPESVIPGSLKTFGPVQVAMPEGQLACCTITVPVLGRALLTGTAGLSNWKLVDHSGLNNENGYPVDQRHSPETVQPPITALAMRPIPEPNFLPRPNGS